MSLMKKNDYMEVCKLGAYDPENYEEWGAGFVNQT
jgi:hypothetical protein